MSNKENNPRLGSLFRQVSATDIWDPAKKRSWERNHNPNAKAFVPTYNLNAKVFVPGKNVGGKKKSKKSKKGGKRKQSKKKYKKK